MIIASHISTPHKNIIFHFYRTLEADDVHVDIDTYNEEDSQSLRETLQWEAISNPSPADSCSTTGNKYIILSRLSFFLSIFLSFFLSFFLPCFSISLSLLLSFFSLSLSLSLTHSLTLSLSPLPPQIFLFNDR